MSIKVDNKKFNVRVKCTGYHNDKSWYVIQFTYYRFKIFRRWKTICHFTGFSYEIYGSYFYTLNFTSHDHAIEFAQRFKTIDDVYAYYSEEKKKVEDFKKQRKKVWEETKPKFKIKNII